jgi:hypothetical protein
MMSRYQTLSVSPTFFRLSFPLPRLSVLRRVVWRSMAQGGNKRGNFRSARSEPFPWSFTLSLSSLLTLLDGMTVALVVRLRGESFEKHTTRLRGGRVGNRCLRAELFLFPISNYGNNFFFLLLFLCPGLCQGWCVFLSAATAATNFLFLLKSSRRRRERERVNV